MSNTERVFVSYLTLRRLVGVLGVLLPAEQDLQGLWRRHPGLHRHHHPV
jgi:hypothetical protein